MLDQQQRKRTPHRHHAVSTHVVVQREGIPYELERTVCRDCARVLSERRLRRAAA
jgi:NMD protein affecting ribosome stability and mRNA decay